MTLLRQLTMFILYAIFIYFSSSVTGLSISHYDLEGANKTCDGKATCESLNTSDTSDEVNWMERNCMCDPLCAKYGDCCVDSPYFLAAEQRRSAASFTCVNLKQFSGVYMMTSCPPKWKSTETRRLCETIDSSDPLATMPVTSTKTGVTYRNAHCALCHNDASDTTLDFWHPRLECPTLLAPLLQMSEENLTNSLTWKPEKHQWGIDLEETWYPCYIDPVLPDTSTSLIRRCEEDIVHACAINWTNSEIRNRCEAYTSVVYEGANAYRNPHCAVCNNVPLQSLTCFKVAYRSFYNKEFSPNAFAILFDLIGKTDSLVGKLSPCDDDQLYDPFFKKCRHVLCPAFHENFLNGKCVIQEHSDDYNDLDSHNDLLLLNDTDNEFIKCPKFLMSPSDYVFTDSENQSIYIETYGRVFGPNQFRIHGDDSVEICADSLGKRLINKFGQYMGYVTAVGLGISIFFLTLHLIAFKLVKDLHNLSGKNLASLCFALLVADISFLSSQSVSTGSTFCIVLAVITHYGYLASFFWMLTMAFDIWRTLKLATFELRVSSGKQWKKFFFYSLWSWLAPATITLAAILVDQSPPEAVDVYIRPLFGVHACWFGHRQALLIFFAAPLAAIMICNIIFFSSSAHMIFSTTSTTRYTASGTTQRDFRLYIRLALVMGLTWITGFLGGYLNVEVLWYCFIALNTLQGLFIFLAFTCNDKVIRGVKNLFHRWDFDNDQSTAKDRRLPSFSWSGASSETTHKSNVGSTSEDSIKDKRNNNYEANLRVSKLAESPFNSLGTSKEKSFDYDTSYHSSRHFDNPTIFGREFENGPKFNPIYGSSHKISKDLRATPTDDTLY